MQSKQISVSLPTDKKGYLGRACPNCKEYFKVKLGTGLKIKTCSCPYCTYSDTSIGFTTKDQYQYAESIAVNQATTDIIGGFFKELKALEFGKKSDFISLRVTTPPIPQFPIKYFREKVLETYITCDSCNLDFAVYGVFCNCPDCGEINAFTVYRKPIEIGSRLLQSIKEQQDLPLDIKEVSLKSILIHLVSSFDALGRELRIKYPSKFPQRPRNLFQNIEELRKIMLSEFGVDITSSEQDFDFMMKLFQVRHIYEHNMGVIDNDFVNKLPNYQKMKGKKYMLEANDFDEMIRIFKSIAIVIEEQLKTD